MFISGYLALKNGGREMSRYTSHLARHDKQGYCRKMRQFGRMNRTRRSS